METDKSYQNLLDKMLRIEKIGDIIYKSIALKVKNKDLRLTYERLALNEQETARYIEKEILALDNNHFILVNDVIFNLAKLICSMLTARQLAWILKKRFLVEECIVNGIILTEIKIETFGICF